MAFDLSLLQDIAQRGRAALDDYRNRQQMSGDAAGQALQARTNTYQALSGQAPAPQPTTGRGPVYDQLLMARNSTRFPAGGANGVVYGQVPDEKGKYGKYAGFEVASDLWNALEGKAQGIRQQDQNEAASLRDIANQGYDQAATGYDDAIQQMYAATEAARHQDFLAAHPYAGVTATGATNLDLTPGPPAANPATATPLGRGEHLTYMPQPTGPTLDPLAAAQLASTTPPATRGSRGFVQGDILGGPQPTGEPPVDPAHARTMALLGNQAADVNYGYGEQGYRQTVNDWLAAQVDPLQQMQGYADQISSTPFSQYAQAAGADYGVDPNIVAGRFGPAEDVRDFGTQRNLSAIQNYGLPYDEVVQQLKAADAAQQNAAGDQQTADEQQIVDQISSMTGVDAKQLSATTNMTPMQLASVVTDPDYQTADAELRKIVSEGDDQAFAETMATIGKQRPDMYEVLLAQYKDYIPSGYDFYSQP